MKSFERELAFFVDPVFPSTVGRLPANVQHLGVRESVRKYFQRAFPSEEKTRRLVEEQQQRALQEVLLDERRRVSKQEEEERRPRGVNALLRFLVVFGLNLGARSPVEIQGRTLTGLALELVELMTRETIFSERERVRLLGTKHLLERREHERLFGKERP